MKIYLTILLFTFSFFSQANECDLTSALKRKLIKNSRHSVDDITCERGVYKWHISNKRYMSFNRSIASKVIRSEKSFEQLIRESRYHVEKITLDERGVKVWRISNAPYMPKEKKLNKKAKRNLASVRKQKKQELLEEIKKAKKHVLTASLYSGVASIASTDTVSNTTEKAVTDIGVGATFVWTHLWSENVSFFAVGSIKSFKFKVGNDRSVSKGDVTQSYIGVGLNFKLSDRFTITPGIGIGESLILNADGANTLSVDKLSIPAGSLGLRTKLIQFNSGFSLDLNTRAGYLLPTEDKGYDAKSGNYYYLGICSSYDLDNKRLFIETGYTGRSLEINDAEQSSKDLGLSVGVGWSF